MAAAVVTLMGWSWVVRADDCCPIPRRVLDPLDQCPAWTGRVDALLLWRDAPQGAPLFDSIAGPSPETALDARDLQSGMAAGPRFTIFRHTGDHGAIEFNYFRVQDFTAARSLPGTDGGYAFAEDLLCCSPITPLNEVDAAMSSELQSFEINRRIPTDGRVQWLAGFRWVQWNESIGLDVATDLPGQAIGIDTDTNNDLYGMQIGADTILLRTSGPFWIEGLGKAGVFYNRSSQFTSYAITLPPDQVAGGTDTSRAAFVGELGVTGVWQMNDWLALRVGWVAFWLGGLAMAPNQLDQQCLICQDKPVRQATDTGGSVFLTGLSIGLEGRW